MKAKANIVIIGGGIVGTSLAYHLACLGIKDIVVLEKDYLAAGSTGRCGAGVRQQWGLKMNCILAKESIAEFEKLSEMIPTDYDLEFKQKGYMMLAYDRNMANQYKKNVQLQRTLGIEVDYLSPLEAKAIVPHLNTEGMVGATFCGKDGHLNPFTTTLTYAIGAKRLGAEIYKGTEVLDMKLEKGKVSKVITNKGEIDTGLVINAAGPFSKNIAKMAGVDIPVYSERHQILVTQPIKQIQDPMVISLKHGFYCQQTPHGSFIMGFGDPNELKGTDTTSTWNFLEEMAEKVLPVLPPLKNLKVVRQWAGSYNMTPDAQPILGNSEDVENFYMAVGFSGHGFMIAPAVAKAISETIVGKKPTVDISMLRLKRFEAGNLIKEPSVV
ncbi:FAD-binding oxidoreductase [Proteinivorax hydrogeniformans]|uniref:FAD-binding oxidoreductase n=1 Tax=Proteinivorax hydrogeniformans TaxID=1826727 RepID=A0AAU8HWJ7_9FIRM